MATESVSTDSSLWIRCFHAAPQAPARLVCFPHAGGSAPFFFPVSRALQPRLEVLVLQYPGRHDRHSERCIDNVAELADHVAAALAERDDGRPYAFFGHSLGATLAFEVARRLQETGDGPSLLFASGRRAPSRFREETVHLLPDSKIVTELGQLSGTDPRLLSDPEVIAMFLPAVRADYRAAETYRYRPGPMLRCPVHVLTGDADPHVTREEAEAWAGHTKGGFELSVFPGGHFFLTERAAEVIALVDTRTPRPVPAGSGAGSGA